MTISHATGTGSRVSCGIEAWPPRPSTTISSMSAEASSVPARLPIMPVRGVGHDVQREGGVGQRVEQPVVEHEAGAVEALLARLEHEAHFAGQLVGARGEHPGGAGEHGRVGVVAAGVHPARHRSTRN